MDVSGNGIGIVNNDASPSIADGTDFGSSDVATGSASHTFTIANSGGATLNLGSVSIAGANAADFAVTLAPISQVPASGSTTFAVTFNPSATGLRSAAVTFVNSDNDENPFTFAIQGTGTASSCPTITLPALPNALANTAYSRSVAASGGTGPYAYALSGGTLPTGVSLSGSTVSGTPSATGLFTFEITATDLSGSGTCTGSRIYEVAIGNSVSAGNLVVREFRQQGPAGPQDEYVVVHNRSAASITVASLDGSTGYGVAGSDGTLIFAIPNGTVIPAHGNFLAVNPAGFSLGAVPDATWAGDLPEGGGLALFKSALTFNTANRLDSVGFAGGVAPYIEGTGLPALGTNTAQHAWVRKYPTGNGAAVKDTQKNIDDFGLVAVDAGTYGPSAVKAVLGAPSPEGLASGTERTNVELPISMIEPTTGQNGAYNRVAIPASGGNPAAIELRRRFTNTTGADLAELRFKVSYLTTLNSVPAAADIRPVFSGDVTVTTPTNGVVLARGVTLEMPSIHTTVTGGGIPEGGLNSTLRVDLSTLPGGRLAAGATIDINFKVFVHGAGSFVYWLVPEAKP
jgi:hypothetical protein